ncbi:alpha/beta-hydrolase [Westerdykella ornata]|uniref:Alpha/beta-hydrolase n=1 Tax=Westerdykella ornata TaxID=318751 RepID=A0A6A6JXE6_WESOR|nr:alpha/beta-hydrolase [Westerdykella ornata]KAF2279739.1 alpha/beta-hydrolase [Westerdykella ornata]
MPVNTITVSAAVTPTVIETAFKHYFNRGQLRQKPTAHISYHEGLELIRRFLHYASFHTVEELQAFTAQWVPVPYWVHVEEVEVPQRAMDKSAEHIIAQLGPEGLYHVGGRTWWQWRMNNSPLKAEWIEMRKDYEERTRAGDRQSRRIMLYVHGGAYFFGSVDTHRYQLQRHARKLKARVIAPNYRLAPQFPFPCGLQDCLATYLYLLDQKHDPSTILLAGDSAGGGLVLSMLVILRDQGLPLPAGAILLSPWVDLTHSFPSLGGDGKLDYIPAHGFVHKPSISWPPPNADDLAQFERHSRSHQDKKLSPRTSHSKSEKDLSQDKTERVHGFSISEASGTDGVLSTEEEDDSFFVSPDGKYSIGPKDNPVLSVQLHDKRIQIKDQIQLYTPNHMLTHPLVSPVLQPTLGGLPPLLIQVGGGELLCDEQIYLAHKAAHPLAYLPPPSNHQSAEDIEAQAARYRPTNVHLQVWDDLAHVTPTLSFTRPAKHMYRAIAQFGAWALARAQKASIDILDDDAISFISTSSSDSSSDSKTKPEPSSADMKLAMPQSAQHVGFESIANKETNEIKVGRAGDPLPPFQNHMIRQRIDRHGRIYDLAPPSELPALNVPRIEVGVPKPGPVNKWMAAQTNWNERFAKQKIKVQRKRLKEMEKGYETFEGEKPPPTALAGRRVKGKMVEKAPKKSWGMALWSLWGSKHDEATVCNSAKYGADLSQIIREEKADIPSNPELSQPTDNTGQAAQKSQPLRRSRSRGNRKTTLSPSTVTSRSRSRSHHTTVTDEGQIPPSSAVSPTDALNRLAPPVPGLAEATTIAPERKASPLPSPRSELSSLRPAPPTPGITIDDVARPQSPQTLIPETDTLSTRPTRGGVAYPFRLKVDKASGTEVNASTATLESFDVRGNESEGEETAGEDVVGEEKRRMDRDSGDAGRPGVERFVTAGTGDLLRSLEAGQAVQEEANDNVGENDDGDGEKAIRPGVERFETAHTSLTSS